MKAEGSSPSAETDRSARYYHAMSGIQPGDILCTRGTGWAARLIRLGAALLDLPNTVNHVIVVSHVDAAGTLWGIEARPGGVGYTALERVIKSPWTVNNALQPKTSEQRAAVVEVAKSMLGTPYDWEGIAEEAMIAVGAQDLWTGKNGTGWEKGKPPAHIICSALADYTYEKVGLESPNVLETRLTRPADWLKLITVKSWNLEI